MTSRHHPHRYTTSIGGPLTLLTALTVLAGCAASSPAAGPSASTPDDTSCSDTSLRPFGCATYRSFDGSDTSGDLAWLSTGPVTITFTTLNQTPTLVITTPCNTLDLPITIDTDQLTPSPNGPTTGTKGCLSTATDQQAWITRLVSSPFGYQLTDDELRLTNTDQTITLRKVTGT